MKNKIKFTSFSTNQQASAYLAEKLFECVKRNPKVVLGLATGSTPIQTYAIFVKLAKKNKLDCSQVKTFNLDEYCGLDSVHPQSYHHFMNEHLFKHLNFCAQNHFFPVANLDYEHLIEVNHGIDCQILGVGSNGHIGFNEPGSDLKSLTRIVDLTPSTIKSNSRFFENESEVPKKAISMGLETILKAKKIFLMAFGKEKATVIERLKKITKFDPDFPASALLKHNDVEVIVDEAANKMAKN